MPLTSDQIADIVSSTLQNYDKTGSYVQAATDLTEFTFQNRLLNTAAVKQFKGTGYEWRVWTEPGSSGKMTGLFDKTTYARSSGLETASVGIRYVTSNFMYDEREADINSPDEVRILDYIKHLDAKAQLDWHTLLEAQIWQTPNVDNTLDILGVPYWVVKNSEAGFNGGAPTGFTTVGGLNPSSVSRWKNYSGTYSLVTEADLIDTMDDAATATNWKSPIDTPELVGGKNYYVFVNHETYKAFKKLVKTQNDNLGTDLDAMNGVARWRGNQIVYVPKLDADTTNPVYIMNMSSFFFVADNGGKWMRSKPHWVGGEYVHQVKAVDYDGAVNFGCYSRRENTVLYQA